MILTDPNKLRVQCIDVLPEEVGPLREALEKELKRSAERGQPGIGLAAPQIGIAKNMAIVRVPNPSGTFFSIDLVNARIAAGYDKSLFENEGCLSFPGLSERTMRYGEIHVVENMSGQERFIATGLLAVCIQHELDHTKGILLPDVALPKPKVTVQKSNNALLEFIKNVR